MENNQMNLLRQRKTYETKTEIEETNQEIQTKQSQISEYETKITEAESKNDHSGSGRKQFSSDVEKNDSNKFETRNDHRRSIR